MTSESTIDVLFRDEHFTVVHKPTGLPTTSPDGGDCLARRVESAERGSEVVHASSRLDAEVTGVVTFARTRRAIEALLAARAAGTYDRVYLALTAGKGPAQPVRWTEAIAIDPRDPRKRRVVEEGVEGRQVAETIASTWAVCEPVTMLHLRPRTGRTHQLRLHASHHGLPLVGDVHYGGPRRLVLPTGRVVSARRTMLHCARVSLPPMLGGAARTFEAPVPSDMLTVWRAVGGRDDEFVLDR